MNRCLFVRVLVALAASASVFTASAQESIRREPPRDVKLARMTVVAPPVIGLDGKEDRLSPGSRIRDVRNMVVLSGGLAGLTLPVLYKRDAAGLVHEVWLLTADEYRRLGGAATGDPEGARRFAELLALIFGARAAVQAR